MILGEQYYKDESLHTEFKEFCFKVDIKTFYPRSIMKTIARNGYILDPKTFNKAILLNLQQYFLSYIPRYTSAFINSRVIDGKLYIGINDYSEVTGVPFFGTKEELRNIISHFFEESLNLIDGLLVHQKDKYVIEIEELDIDINYLSDSTEEIIEMFADKKATRNILFTKYKKDRERWIKRLREYTCRLDNLIITKRDEIVDFLEINAPHMIDEIHQPSLEEIDKNKTNPDHFVYWLVRFKDQVIEEHIRNKPQTPIVPKLFDAPFYLLTQLSDMRKKFVVNNKNLKYYLIKVNFPPNVKSQSISFYHIYKKKWELKYRVINPYIGPCCL